MKKFLIAVLFLTSLSAHASYTMIVAQEPGGGTSVWASIVAKHLEKYLGEEIVIRHIPGARDIPGFNEFHNKLRFDNKTIMVTHGAHAESFLVEKVDYDYKNYEPIGGMNLSAVVAHTSSFDPYQSKSVVRFSTGSGFNPDAIAMTLLVCGNLPSIEAYLNCYKEKILFVKGMKANERRLAFIRGELNTTRESTAAFIKHVQPMIDRGEVKLWFSHGVYDRKTGKNVVDKNFPESANFENVFARTWKQQPKGPLYEAYLLVKNHRDVLQKALWVNKDNPNATRVRAALVAMLNDPEAVKDLEKDSGKYDWFIGQELVGVMEQLQSQIKKQTLENLVRWEREAFGIEAIFKQDLIKR